MKQRIDSIDVARGIAMLLVIVQHCGAYSQFILSFHMPLFFMVSGLVLTGSKPSSSFWQDLKKMLGGYSYLSWFWVFSNASL